MITYPMGIETPTILKKACQTVDVENLGWIEGDLDCF